MTMTYVWTAITLLSCVFGLLTGNGPQVGNAALEGAQKAVELSISLCGAMCLWTGIMEVLKRAGGVKALVILLRPLLKLLFSEKTLEDAGDSIAANMAANMLGLGNAATPLGIDAVRKMKQGDSATDDMCMLTVINTASIQLIPTTAAVLRAAAGSQNPFEILPAVWITSAASITAGVAAAKTGAFIWKN